MKILYVTFCMTVILLFGACVSTAPVTGTSKNSLVLGVYEKGSNVTEPRPKKSKYLQVTRGGVSVQDGGAGLFIFSSVIQAPKVPLYITVEYEDPIEGVISNDMQFLPDAKGFGFSSPRLQRGLKPYKDYQITVRIWEYKGAAKPIDSLTQKVRCYVDTRGDEIRILSGMDNKP